MRSGLFLVLLSGLAWLAACSAGAPVDPAPTARLSWSRSASGGFAITLAGQELGRLRPSGQGWTLRGEDVDVALATSRQPAEPPHAYPQRVRTQGTMAGSEVAFREEYTLLAPPAPLPVEGFGLEVSDDSPGTNTREHRLLRRWLAGQGLPAETTRFEDLHREDTGRELRVWYEISGRRVDGVFARLVGGGAAEPLARVDSLFRSEDGGLKIHHKRPGENGRFDYHRRSLELADAIASSEAAPELRAHQCGCYGYAIAADFMTLGAALYHVEADWLDDRVGAEFFLGLETRETFPWVGLGDRLRMRNLARRARAFLLEDAAGDRFAEVRLELPADPPAAGLGPITYRFDVFDAKGQRQPLARVAHGQDEVVLDFFSADETAGSTLERLDLLLAAMPVQVVRGDGLRDSHLGEIERLVDAVRLLRQPGESHLADFVSEVDAHDAARKVRALLEPEHPRFEVAAEELPPAPIPGPGRGTRQARQTGP
jgi:hypothetical protein